MIEGNNPDYSHENPISKDNQLLHLHNVHLKSRSLHSVLETRSSHCLQKSLFCHLPENFKERSLFPCLFGTILKNTTDLIAVKDRDFNYLIINQRGAAQFGKLPQEVIGKDDTSFFPPHIARRILADDRKVFDSGSTLTFEESLLDYRGELRTFLSTKGPVFDNKGYVIGLFTVSKDITLQKRTEERLKLALEAGKIGICDWDIGRRKIYWNAEQKKLFGLEETSGTISVGKAFSLIHPNDRSGYAAQFSEAKNKGEAFQTEFRIQRPDGALSWIEQFADFVGDGNGEPRRMVAANLDITDRKNAESALVVTKENAEKANQIKSNLLAHISHEIRSPITVVQGMIDLALNTPLSPEQNHYLKQAREAADLLSYVIDDILDFSTIEAKKLKLQSQPFVLKTCIEHVIDMLSQKAKEKDLTLYSEIAEDLPEWITGDEYRLEQVLMNLVGNAIKFTHHGHVKLTVNFESREKISSDHYLRFSVKDTGVGINEETKNILFQPFTQGNESFNQMWKGTGLGLTICKEIVSLFNGEIWFESEVGKGSVFTFTARFGKFEGTQDIPAKAGEETIPSPRALPAKLLLVEDSSMLRNFLNLILSGQNFQVVLAKNGFEALEKYESEVFDLVLMDVQMPEMDGLETTRRIRGKEHELGRSTPIIALTAHAMKEHERLCLDSGMNDFISKPIKIPQFLAKLNEYIN